jgi:tRNA pseudouridine38-40 synthase
MVSGNRNSESVGSRRLAFLVQYYGSDFNGWQIQPEGRSVQIELERACEVLLKHKVKIVASGRTDTGVHALGQVVHFDTESDSSLLRICKGINGILPSDVSVLNVFDVPPDFSARFSPVGREYLYLIYNAPQRSPFVKNRAAWISRPLDVDYLNDALSHLRGEHDFSSFCKTPSAKDKNTVRTMHDVFAVRNNEFIEVTIRGNAFLHNMVRSIVGTAVELERKGFAPVKMKEILESMDRRVAFDTAPACGLYLRRISYDPPLSSMPSAYPDYEAPLNPPRG